MIVFHCHFLLYSTVSRSSWTVYPEYTTRGRYAQYNLLHFIYNILYFVISHNQTQAELNK